MSALLGKEAWAQAHGGDAEPTAARLGVAPPGVAGRPVGYPPAAAGRFTCPMALDDVPETQG